MLNFVRARHSIKFDEISTFDCVLFLMHFAKMCSPRRAGKRTPPPPMLKIIKCLAVIDCTMVLPIPTFKFNACEHVPNLFRSAPEPENRVQGMGLGRKIGFRCCLIMGTPKIYPTTGFGRNKKKKMAGVDHFLVYMQTAVKYNTFYIHHPGGAAPRGGVYTNGGILQQFAYTPRNGLHQPLNYFLQAQIRWWCIFLDSLNYVHHQYISTLCFQGLPQLWVVKWLLSRALQTFA